MFSTIAKVAGVLAIAVAVIVGGAPPQSPTFTPASAHPMPPAPKK